MVDVLTPGADKWIRPDEVPRLPEWVTVKAPEKEPDLDIACIAISDTSEFADALEAITTDEQVRNNLVWLSRNLAGGKSYEELAAMAEDDWDSGEAFRFIVLVDDKPAGFYAVTKIADDEVETTSGLVEQYRRRGIGSAVTTSIEPLIPLNLGIVKTSTYKPPDNEASLAHAASVGGYVAVESDRPDRIKLTKDLSHFLDE